MNGIKIFGEYVFEYVVITILLGLSFALVIPFIPVFIGVVSYFKFKSGERMIKDIFIPIKENIKIIIPFTVFELILLGISALNLYYNLNHEMNGFFLILSYVGLFLGAVILMNGTTIILKMQVNFIQLLANSILLIFGGIINSAILIGVYVAYFLISISYPIVFLLGIYFICYLTNYWTTKNINTLKARKYNLTLAELEAQDNPLNEVSDDDFYTN